MNNSPQGKLTSEELWNNLTDILEEQFPKGKCKERGNALVLLSYIKMAFDTKDKLHAETEAKYEAEIKIWKGVTTVDAEIIQDLQSQIASLVASKLVVPTHPNETFDKVLDVARENKVLQAQVEKLKTCPNDHCMNLHKEIQTSHFDLADSFRKIDSYHSAILKAKESIESWITSEYDDVLRDRMKQLLHDLNELGEVK